MSALSLLTLAALTGSDDGFIDHASLERPVHRDIVEPWRQLCAAAAAAGFAPAIASGYRDYSRQLSIWNGKARGARAVLDGAGRPLALAGFDDWQKAAAILRWSALPGASRHHWGSDIDIYDRAAVADDYAVQLTAAEADGVFGAFHRWLDGRIAAGRAYGFFRPYAADRGGVAPERWHLSYAPLAVRCQQRLDRAALWREIDTPALELRDAVAAHWHEIYERYIRVPATAYPEPYAALLQEQADER